MAKGTHKRQAISKRKRFEVLKRDNFTCQYCSSKPPKVPLEVDHIVPVSKGGKNDMSNLITACLDCNRGKSDVPLDNVPPTLSEKTERKQLAVEQYKQYQRVLKKAQKQINDDIDLVERTYGIYSNGYMFTDRFRISVKRFINDLGVEEVNDSMEIACTKVRYGDPLNYFCGICWSKIRENE